MSQPMANPKVLLTRIIPGAGLEMLRAACEVALWEDELPPPRGVVLRELAQAEGVLCLLTDRIDAEIFAAAPRLRAISTMSVGYDNVDIAAATARGIPVGHTPGVLTETTADFAFALLLAAARRISEGERFVRAGRWRTWGPTLLMGQDIHGATLGIVGLGRIGQAVARRARAFGMSIHYYNRQRVSPQIEEELSATYWESLDQMLARMDIISINCPHTPATYHLLSARRLKLMRPEAYIVNTARGEVIDENALTRMIEAGELAGAGLDVFEHEPAVSPKLVKLARAGKVVLLPHMGSATLEGRIDMGEKVIVNIKTFMDGHRPPDRVLPSML
jgi:glyoxylate reductase